MPPTEVSSMVVTPTRSEMRLPWSTRLQMSRPNSSVPRKCRPLGGWSRAAGSRRVGLCVESGPAKSAASTKARRMRAPATTLRLARRRRSQRGRVEGAPTPTAGPRTSTAASVIADPRVDDRVQEIDPEVDQHVGRGDQTQRGEFGHGPRLVLAVDGGEHAVAVAAEDGQQAVARLVPRFEVDR